MVDLSLCDNQELHEITQSNGLATMYFKMGKNTQAIDHLKLMADAQHEIDERVRERRKRIAVSATFAVCVLCAIILL